MRKVTIEDVDNSTQPAAVMRGLTGPLGLTDLAINYYELEPGDSFAFAYHNHEIQAEVFYVQEGTAVFETETGSVTVDAGEIIRFGPGEFQRGWNRGEQVVRALALGAPLEYGEQVKLRDCPECGEQTRNRLDAVENGSAVVAVCSDCGTETGRWVEGSMDGTVP
jgi:uncharacterized cupin superfamily protein